MTDDQDPMDDPIDGIDDLDELLSAHLDAELELYEERPDLDDEIVAGRLSELRAVADAVGASVPPVAPSVVDDQIANALAALPSSSTAPTSLTAARAARRRGRSGAALPVIASAAAILVVVFGFAVLVSGISGDSDDSADADSGEEFATGAVDATEFRADDGDVAEGGESEAALAEAAPEADDAGDDSGVDEATDAATSDGEETADDEAADETAETEAPADDTEAPEETQASSAPTTTVPFDPAADVEVTDVCRDFLLTELDADDYLGANEVDRATLRVYVVRDDAPESRLIDPARCDGIGDPFVEDAP